MSATGTPVDVSGFQDLPRHAISTLVILPPSILGWFAQRSLVKGLTAGSVKG